MAIYQRLLCVVDLLEDAPAVAARAAQLARSCDARLDLLHVFEFVPVEPMGETLMPAVQIEEELIERARQRLATLAADLGLTDSELLVEAGSVKTEIIRVAREREADLIIIGSRERHGPSILVNFTEDTVLHAAPCDVLAVRVSPPRSPTPRNSTSKPHAKI